MVTRSVWLSRVVPLGHGRVCLFESPRRLKGHVPNVVSMDLQCIALHAVAKVITFKLQEKETFKIIQETTYRAGNSFSCFRLTDVDCSFD